MAARQRFGVTVSLTDGDSTRSLLSMASTLHRRAACVSRAELSPASHGRQIFSATFTATGRQAATVCASLGNLVDVLDVALDPPVEPLGMHPDAEES